MLRWRLVAVLGLGLPFVWGWAVHAMMSRWWPMPKREHVESPVKDPKPIDYQI